MDLGQVKAEDTNQRGPDTKGRHAHLLDLCTWTRQLTGVVFVI